MSAFVPKYHYDIFVSYAHVDNSPVHGLKIGWVDHLVDTLENIIAQSIGRNGLIQLWMDTRKEQAILTPEILEKVKASATLLIILSPGYLASDFCQDELTSFLENLRSNSKGSAENGNFKRIFIVEKTSYRVTRPPELQQNIPYLFWYEDNRRIRTLGWPKFNPDEIEYYLKLQDMVYDLIDELEELNKNTTGRHG